ncbi:MAG: UDP-4-amino-4,6-dideoxy-N-acetyl-beta-L-altrosamine transaminase [Nitrospirae bacterium]|nr:UDP-4-amino-4,6-dideoxy-N-acetyl-beta-L-altrosamine transaminase [Nitrospirota bacterium]
MPYNNHFIPYGRQWIDEEDIQAVVNVLRSDWLTQGPEIEKFENEIAAYCGARHAVVFNSGTSALHGAYAALGLGEGHEFITTPITFAATANAGVYLGAKPVFVDVEEETGNIDTSKIEAKITKKTKLIIPVHYAGHPVELFKINELAEKYDLFVVEDACHALGARYRRQEAKGKGQKADEDDWIRIGSCKHSDMTAFSFHPVKHITTGEGGAVTTNNRDFYERLLMFRSHGITKKHLLNEPDGDWYYEMQMQGYNYRMTDIQAALGKSQLIKLDSFVQKRRKIAGMYNKFFYGNPCFDVPGERGSSFSAYHLYPLRIKVKYKELKKAIVAGLKEKSIGTQVHYIPVYRHPFYREMGYEKGLCPVAEDFYAGELSIPMYPAMSDEDASAVISGVEQVFGKVCKL